jgi:hypothetical protein
MTKQYRTATVLVVMAHIAIVAVLFFAGTAAMVATSRDDPSAVAISFVSSTVHEATPSSESVVDTAPETHAAESSRQQIVPSTNRVVREHVSSAAPVPAPEEIANELLGSFGDVATSMRIQQPDQDAPILRAAFYAPWLPPSRHEVADAKVAARVVFESDGRVSRAEIESPSGIPSLDTSVVNALERVSRVEGLSDATLKNSDGVTIVFSVTE